MSRKFGEELIASDYELQDAFNNFDITYWDAVEQKLVRYIEEAAVLSTMINAYTLRKKERGKVKSLITEKSRDRNDPQLRKIAEQISDYSVSNLVFNVIDGYEFMVLRKLYEKHSEEPVVNLLSADPLNS